MADQLKRCVAPEHLACLDEDLRHAPEPGVGADQDREERPDEYDESGCLRGEPEPYDSKRDPGERGDGPEDLDDRVDDGIGDPEPAHGDPDRDTEKERSPYADGKVFETDHEVSKESSGSQEVDERGGGIGETRQDERVGDDQVCYCLPDDCRGRKRRYPEESLLLLSIHS